MARGPAYVIIGRILRPHGVRGEVRVAPDTDFPERWATLAEAVVLRGDRATPVRVTAVRRHGDHVLVRLAGVETPEQAAALRGAALAVRREEAMRPPPGAHFVFEVLGLTVVTEAGAVVGTVTGILRTPAHDVYVVTAPDGREYLIPAVGAVVVAVDPPGGRVVVRPLPGLLE
ncbi:MAG: ribosome maturation factor RimM [Armatimonadota bacterium]|nr:ribosome maturation factor RimM [Armatimonadota bacterium]MDR7404889.1 ribosome maturation factor RimM [Armatimonadota bacterium]